MPNAQVFISYDHANASFAHRLAEDLRRLGAQVWIAPESIRAGESWVDGIERGLQESKHMLVVLTPAAVESQWVKKETDVGITRERQKKMKIIPLEVESCTVPLLLNTYQRISFRGDYSRGLAQLANVLGVQPVSPVVQQRTTTPVLTTQFKTHRVLGCIVFIIGLVLTVATVHFSSSLVPVNLWISGDFPAIYVIIVGGVGLVITFILARKVWRG